TREAIELSLIAQNAKADALLTVTPYYNKPTQDGIYAHFKAIHDSTDLPIILYNVPSRTVVEICVETVLRLAELPRIVGIKDATSDTGRTTLIRSQVKDNFSILSGEDALAGAFLAQGADGCISVTSNVAPRLCAELQNAWIANNRARFEEVQTKLAPLNKALFCESNPTPVKYAVSRLGLASDEVRLPLLAASASARKAVEDAMIKAGLAV
ncbi:MAG: 4-hydroxy-tetrahydrodipicolinate synthase, partial [Micavibrio aeruginosavorus]